MTPPEPLGPDGTGRPACQGWEGENVPQSAAVPEV